MGNRSVADLEPGETGTIKGFTDNVISLKLMEMGCLPGTSIKMNVAAPFGDPISYYVAGYNLTLRISEASAILIE